SRKPSRVRAAETAHVQGVERANRPPKKAGWAKAGAPNPRGPSTKTPWKPREEGAAGGERPARVFKPREDKIIGPKSATWARDGDKPRRDFKPRDGAGAPRSSGPRSGPGGPRPTGAKPGGSRGPSRG
ncbi:MAG: pseudouridine synthase, partial [Planctomycetales bacterium 12-60-4]